MRLIVSLTILLLSIFNSITSTYHMDSFQEFKSENTGYCNSTTPAFCHLQYFLQYVVFGKPNLNQTNIFDLIEKVPDGVDLLSIIVLLSQNFNEFWTDNDYYLDTFEGKRTFELKMKMK